MRKLLATVSLFSICTFFLCQEAPAQSRRENSDPGSTLKLMTYNLKFASPDFKPTWEERRQMQVELIRKYDPDVIGTQEGLKEQVDWLADHLPEYVVVGEGRKGGDDDEHMAIFFKKDKFRLREMHSFQLSETPDIIGSGPSVNPRMVTWMRLAFVNRPAGNEKSQHPQDYRGHWENSSEFYIFNTHYFNGRIDTLARVNASKLILKRVNALNRFGSWTPERPLFLMGDFNCRPGSAPYRILVGENGANDPDLFRNSLEDKSKIDWILYKGTVRVKSYEEVDFNVKGVYPSDHKPICVEFELLNKQAK